MQTFGDLHQKLIEKLKKSYFLKMDILNRLKRKIKFLTLSKIHSFLSKEQKTFSEKDKEEILKYRKNIKIYDAFIFYNELETLEMRLNILDPYVDYFVIVECDKTFSGLSKELYFQNNIEKFEKFKNKIIHYVIKDAPKNEDDLIKKLQDNNTSQIEKNVIRETLTNDNVPKGQDQWLREFYQRESIKKARALTSFISVSWW
jgi:hypothetical protein